MPDARKSGSISRLVPEKRYGFITCLADNRDYFFHQSHLDASIDDWTGDQPFLKLHVGDVVEFTVGQCPRGLEAQEITRTEVVRIGDPTLPKLHKPKRRVNWPKP